MTAPALPPTRIRPLTLADADDLFRFEWANRAWFRGQVPDRGDAYFEQFPARHRALLEEQRDGGSRFWLVVDRDGELVGRVNLVDDGNRAATLGYRIGRQHVGRGHATRAVRLALREAAALGFEIVLASTTVDNVASQRVLAGAGFVSVDRGPATLDVDGRAVPARHFEARRSARW